MDEGEPHDANPSLVQLHNQLIHQFLLQSQLALLGLFETTWQPIYVILNQNHYVAEL
jgi:hypothetical protein